MGEVIEPLDAGDAEAIAAGMIAPDEARPVDESDTEPGLDSERPVLLEERRDSEATPTAGSGDGMDVEYTADPADQ